LTAVHSGEGHLAGSWQGKLLTSDDGGLTWSEQAFAGTTYVLASTPGWVYAGTSTGVQRTSDNVTWSRVTGFAAAPSLAVSGSGENLLVRETDGAKWATKRSADGGATWVDVVSADLDVLSQVHFTFDQSDDQHAFALTPAGLVAESLDGGATWAVIRDA
jgi:photosystem II stability/assembly factor-like uncharacterized protein